MDTGVIDEYLDALLRALRVEPARARRILAETEDHLREAVTRRIESGMSTAEAERAAIAAFGAPATVAASFNQAGVAGFRSWAFPLAAWLLLLGSIGVFAAGLAGEITVGLGISMGKQYVSGETNGVTYTAARCGDFLGFYPAAGSCDQAAVLHHFDEIWRNADLAIILGVLGAIAGYAWLRRLRPARPSLGRRLFAILGMAAFGGAAPLLLAYGTLTSLANSGVGGLLYLVGGAVALLFFVPFARPGWRELHDLAMAAAV